MPKHSPGPTSFPQDSSNEILSSILDQISARGTVCYIKNLSGSWGMGVTQHSKFSRFHVVLCGSAWVKIPATDEKIFLKQYDSVIVNDGLEHSLSSDIDSAITAYDGIPGSELLQIPKLERTPADDRTILVCGYFEYVHWSAPLIEFKFPPVIVHSTHCNARHHAVVNLSTMLLDEINAAIFSSRIVINRLTELLFLMASRQWIESRLDQDGAPLAAWMSGTLGRAIAALHSEPERAWKVEDLARMAGQSRSAFSSLFRTATGSSPIEYQNKLKMTLAQRMLVETGLRLDDIAERTGYSDLSTFSRAFSRHTGLSPSRYRGYHEEG